MKTSPDLCDHTSTFSTNPYSPKFRKKFGMNIVLLGPPGSGKGTQAKKLAQRFGLAHLCVGDILREEVTRKTPLGKKVEDFLSEGELVPDALVTEVVKERLEREVKSPSHWRVRSDDTNSASLSPGIAPHKGVILDGFPRTIGQAKALDGLLFSLSLSLDKVIYLKIEKEEAVKRLSGRRSCPGCGGVYHLVFKPPKKSGKCDRCGGDLIQREDDGVEVVTRRFPAYERETLPLISYYKKAGTLVEIEAENGMEMVFEELSSLVEEKDDIH